MALCAAWALEDTERRFTRISAELGKGMVQNDLGLAIGLKTVYPEAVGKPVSRKKGAKVREQLAVSLRATGGAGSSASEK